MNVEVRGGAFAYRDHLLFENMNLSVREQSVLTILGPNGVGKTTLLRCLMGFLSWKTGETYLNDKPMSAYTHREVWSRISYVPQAKQSPFAYRVIDTVVMGLNASSGIFSIPSRADYERAGETMEWLGIRSLADRSCNEISGGQLQMVLIARALVGDPEVLILDEPESNLDMRNQLRVLSAIQRIALRKTTTCIINTHFPDHALMISDDTLFMGHGGRRLIGPTSEIISEDSIREFYGVCARAVPFEAEGKRMRTIFPYRLV